MSLTVSSSGGGGDFTPPPAGTHVARCYRVIDLGTQHNPRYDSWQRKVLIGWEIPAALMDDGKPFSVSARYTASLNDKAYMRRDLESWRGVGFTQEELDNFHLKNVLGAPCLINVVHNDNGDKTYANVAAIMPLPAGMTCPPPVNKPLLYEIEDGHNAVYEALGDGMKKVINQCKEWTKGTEPAAKPAPKPASATPRSFKAAEAYAAPVPPDNGSHVLTTLAKVEAGKGQSGKAYFRIDGDNGMTFWTFSRTIGEMAKAHECDGIGCMIDFAPDAKGFNMVRGIVPSRAVPPSLPTEPDAAVAGALPTDDDGNDLPF